LKEKKRKRKTWS